MMKLDLDTLAQVTGGASKSSELTSSLSAINSSISDLKYSQNNSGSSNLLLPVMLMAMNRRQQGSTVVSAGGATVVQG